MLSHPKVLNITSIIKATIEVTYDPTPSPIQFTKKAAVSYHTVPANHFHVLKLGENFKKTSSFSKIICLDIDDTVIDEKASREKKEVVFKHMESWIQIFEMANQKNILLVFVTARYFDEGQFVNLRHPLNTMRIVKKLEEQTKQSHIISAIFFVNNNYKTYAMEYLSKLYRLPASELVLIDDNKFQLEKVGEKFNAYDINAEGVFKKIAAFIEMPSQASLLERKVLDLRPEDRQQALVEYFTVMKSRQDLLGMNYLMVEEKFFNSQILGFYQYSRQKAWLQLLRKYNSVCLPANILEVYALLDKMIICMTDLKLPLEEVKRHTLIRSTYQQLSVSQVLEDESDALELRIRTAIKTLSHPLTKRLSQLKELESKPQKSTSPETPTSIDSLVNIIAENKAMLLSKFYTFGMGLTFFYGENYSYQIEKIPTSASKSKILHR